MKTNSEIEPEGSENKSESLARKLEQEIATFADEQKKHSLKFRTQLRDQLRALTEHLSLVSQLASIVGGITERELSEVMDPSSIDLNLLWRTDDVQLDKQLDKQLAKEILKLNEVASTLSILFKKRDVASWGREQSMPHLDWLGRVDQKVTELEQATKSDDNREVQDHLAIALDNERDDLLLKKAEHEALLSQIFRQMRVAMANDPTSPTLPPGTSIAPGERKMLPSVSSLPNSNQNESYIDQSAELQRFSEEEYAGDTKHRRDLLYAFDRRPTLSEAVLQILSDGDTYSTFDIATAGWEIENKTSSEYKQLRPKLTKTIWREFKERKNIDQVKRGLYSSRYFESREDAIEDAFRRGALVDLRPFYVNFDSDTDKLDDSSALKILAVDGDGLASVQINKPDHIFGLPRDETIKLGRFGRGHLPFSGWLRIAPHPDYSVRLSFWDWKSRDATTSLKVLREEPYPDSFTEEEIETELEGYISDAGLNFYLDVMSEQNLIGTTKFTITSDNYQEIVKTFAVALEERLVRDCGFVLLDSFIELSNPSLAILAKDESAESSDRRLLTEWSQEGLEDFLKRKGENAKNDPLARVLGELRSRAKDSRNNRAQTPPINHPIYGRTIGEWDPMFDYSLYDSDDPTPFIRVLNESFAVDDAEILLLAVELGIIDRVGSTYIFEKNKLASLESSYDEHGEQMQVRKHGKAHPFDRSSEVHHFLLQHPAVRDEIHALIVMEVAKLQPPLQRLSKKPARWPKEGFRSRLNERTRA